MAGLMRKLARQYLGYDQIEGRPSITAIVSALNEEKSIEVTLQSIMNQRYPVDQLIVVDNGSTDRTAEIAGKYADVYREDEKGVSRARNRGARKATGNILMYGDADTPWDEGVTERAMESIRNGYSCGSFKLAADVNSEEAETFYGAMNAWNSLTPLANILGKNMRTGSGAVMYFRADDLREVEAASGFLFDESRERSEDTDLFGRMQEMGYWAEFVQDLPVKTSARRVRKQGKWAIPRNLGMSALEMMPKDSWATMAGKWLIGKYGDVREDPEGLEAAYA